MEKSSIMKKKWSNPLISVIIIVVLTAVLFTIFQSTGTFADPDSFYHAKISLLLADQGVVQEFPWAHFTTLAENYADQHFLYHVFLVPFVKSFDPLIGLKVATVILGIILMLVFYYVLKSFNIRWPLFYTLLLLTINPFTFRMNLGKANAISLILLLIGFSLIVHYRWRWLALLSFLYVWFYGGFTLLLVIVTIYVVVSWIINRYRHRQSSHRFLHKLYSLTGLNVKRRKKFLNLNIWLSVFFGLLAGVILNPYWPKNLVLYLQQLIEIGAVNYREIIGVGSEWYPYGFIDLVSNTVVVTVLAVLALLGFIIFFKKQSKFSITSMIVWLFFLLLTLKSRRYVEYYVPFAMLFSAMAISDSTKDWPWSKYWYECKKIWKYNVLTKILSVMLAIFIIIGLPYVVGRDVISEYNDHKSGFRLDEYKTASEWLNNNSTAGSIVLHDDWDEFPLLFYHNSHNYYIVGLDPTFMFIQDQTLYWQWVQITRGQYIGDPTIIIRESFGASYVFVSRDHVEMDGLISKETNFPIVYEDAEARIYQVTNAK